MEINGHKSGNTETGSVRSWDVKLRISGLLLTLLAAIMVGLGKETKTVAFTLVGSSPPLQMPVTARWQYMSALVYLLVSNVVACSYAAGSLAYALASRSAKNNNTKLELVILDMLVMGLLFSANGATAAIGVIGKYGNSHAHWNKVCNAFDGFCHLMSAAFASSLVGSFAFLSLGGCLLFSGSTRNQFRPRMNYGPSAYGYSMCGRES